MRDKYENRKEQKTEDEEKKGGAEGKKKKNEMKLKKGRSRKIWMKVEKEKKKIERG